jgi:hypothetical protein
MKSDDVGQTSEDCPVPEPQRQVKHRRGQESRPQPAMIHDGALKRDAGQRIPDAVSRRRPASTFGMMKVAKREG